MGLATQVRQHNLQTTERGEIALKIILAGDTHGSVVSVTDKIDSAKKVGVQRIVVLGDFRSLVGL